MLFQKTVVVVNMVKLKILVCIVKYTSVYYNTACNGLPSPLTAIFPSDKVERCNVNISIAEKLQRWSQ